MKKKLVIMACVGINVCNIITASELSFWERTKAKAAELKESATKSAKKTFGTDEESIIKKGKATFAKFKAAPTDANYKKVMDLQKLISSERTATVFQDLMFQARKIKEGSELFNTAEVERRRKADDQRKRAEEAKQRQQEEQREARQKQIEARQQAMERASEEDRQIEQSEKDEFQQDFSNLTQRRIAAANEADDRKSQRPQISFNNDIDLISKKYKSPEHKRKLEEIKFFIAR